MYFTDNPPCLRADVLVDNELAASDSCSVAEYSRSPRRVVRGRAMRRDDRTSRQREGHTRPGVYNSTRVVFFGKVARSGIGKRFIFGVEARAVHVERLMPSGVEQNAARRADVAEVGALY